MMLVGQMTYQWQFGGPSKVPGKHDGIIFYAMSSSVRNYSLRKKKKCSSGGRMEDGEKGWGKKQKSGIRMTAKTR